MPFMATVMYVSLHTPEHSLPGWFPYFGLSYILVTVIFVMLFSQRVYRGVRPENAEKPKSVWGWRLGIAWTAYLVAVWSVLFLRGAYLTFTGGLDWRRSVPAGAFLLAFIVLFSWALYKALKGKYAATAAERKQARD